MLIGEPATNLCAGMIYLRENPLLGEPLRPEQSKNVLLGHWGSDPGQHKWGGALPALAARR
jgi:phosphoketolase